MPTTVKDMLAAARAAVPTITPADAADLVAKSDALVVDVRDGTEVAASGKVKGALAVSRGLLEFTADPDLPTHDAALAQRSSCDPLLRVWRSGRACWQDPAGYGVHGHAERRRIQGVGRCRVVGRAGLIIRDRC